MGGFIRCWKNVQENIEKDSPLLLVFSGDQGSHPGRGYQRETHADVITPLD
jgi:hypothetical protein